MICRWVNSELPRLVCHDRHERGEWCEDCTACPETHCRVCNLEHQDQYGTCGGCLAEVRDTLREIRRLCDDLPEEVEVRGVDGEAFNLLGPVTDPEAWGHRAASILSGRIVPMDCDARDIDDVRAWLDRADHERHPLWTVTTWAMCYRDAFGHDEPTTAVNLATEIGYLERNLTYAGALVDVPFEDFARDLRASLAHTQRVLHDEERGEFANANCFDCGHTLERKLGASGFDDAWTCRGCRRRYSIADYNLALRAKLEESA